MNTKLSATIPATLTVRTFSETEKLRDAWRTLQTSVDAPPFLQIEWVDAALQWQPTGATPQLLLILRGQQAIGIGALLRKPVKRYGLTYRVLEFIQVPDTQSADFLAASADYSAVVDVIANYLAAQTDWDELRFTRLAANDIKKNLLAKAFAHANLAGRWTLESPNPYIRLDQSWETFYAGRSRRLKKGNNLIANKLKKAHAAIDVEWLHGPDISAALWREALDAAISISANSWKRSTGLTLDQAGANNFIEHLSKIAIQTGWLSLWLLRLDGQVAAMEYQLAHKGVIHALRADYDDNLADLSPGSYLNWKLLEQLCDRGFTRYEMGPGDNAYKQRWAEDNIPLYRFASYNNTFKGRLLRLIDFHLKPLAKSIVNTFKKTTADTVSPDKTD